MSDLHSEATPDVVVDDPARAPSVRASGVIITMVRVIHFHCLRAVEFPLGSTTVLIGENNAGKTSFLEALHAAIGAGQRHFSEEDIWLDAGERHAPRDRSIIVDVLIRPVDDANKVIETFPEGSPWLELWGTGIQQDDNDHDYAAIRTQFAWSVSKGEYLTERKFLREWPDSIADALKAALSEKVPPVTVSQSTPISLYLLDAKRDGADDIRSRSSIWHKLVSDHGLPDNHVQEIEKLLTQVNEAFVRESKVLAHLLTHLISVADVVNCDKGAVSIAPVARRLRDLSKGMDVILSTVGASAFPLSRQGMGTRSLTSVLVFRAYMSWRLSERTTDAIHPFLAIEEPETHLHPQAQRSLFGQIQQIPGQRIISTHSPYICANADILTFLHFRKIGSETRICRFADGGNDLSGEDMRRINREVMHTRGDLLFSRHIVLFEGETEEQALPMFAHLHWGCHPHEVGVTFIGVGGKDAYTPFLRLASRFGIPWCILSDGAPTDMVAVNKCLERAGLDQHPVNPAVYQLPSGHDFEGYVANADNHDLLCDMIADYLQEESATSGGTLMNDRGKEVVRRTLGGKPPADIAAELRKRKTTFGARVAAALNKHTDEQKRIPAVLKQVLDHVRPPVTTGGTPFSGVFNGS